MEKFIFSAVNSFFYTNDQIKKIRKCCIGIAGAGGIGSNCASILVRCGFQNLVLADFDQVSLSNLNRQTYTCKDLGRNKVECLKETLLSINPDLHIEAHACKIDRKNVHKIFDHCNIIAEAFDDPECKSMIVEEFISSGKMVVAISGIGGYGNSDRLVTRKMRENFYIVGDGLSEVGEKIKPFAPVVVIAAAKQADLILSYVLEEKMEL